MGCSHEEADVIIPQQLIYAVNEGAKCIQIVSDDSDVFVILLHFYHQLKLEATVLLEPAPTTNNKQS